MAGLAPAAGNHFLAFKVLRFGYDVVNLVAVYDLSNVNCTVANEAARKINSPPPLAGEVARPTGPAKGRPDGKLRPEGEGVAGGGSLHESSS
jgi:hypothetical protein